MITPKPPVDRATRPRNSRGDVGPLPRRGELHLNRSMLTRRYAQAAHSAHRHSCNAVGAKIDLPSPTPFCSQQHPNKRPTQETTRSLGWVSARGQAEWTYVSTKPLI